MKVAQSELGETMGAKILVIEDNTETLELMVFLLEYRGHSLLCAENGETGIQLIEKERPDLILCDIQIPLIDGYELVRRIKARNSLFKHIPIIAITAFAMIGDREKILLRGFDGYISKPIEVDFFADQIESYLSVNKLKIKK